LLLLLELEEFWQLGLVTSTSRGIVISLFVIIIVVGLVSSDIMLLQEGVEEIVSKGLRWFNKLSSFSC